MGSHQTKSYNEQLHRSDRKLQHFLESREKYLFTYRQSRAVKNKTNKIAETVMDERNRSVVSMNEMDILTYDKTTQQQVIAVADFAKIKFDPEDHCDNEIQSSPTEPALESDYSQHESVPDTPHEIEGNIISCGEAHSKEIGDSEMYLKRSKDVLNNDADVFLNIKREVIESQDNSMDILSAHDRFPNANNTAIELNSTEANEMFSESIKSEILENGTHFDKNANNVVLTLNTVELKSEAEENVIVHNFSYNYKESQHKTSKLVKNPLALLKKRQNLESSNMDCSLKENVKNSSVNTEIKFKPNDVNEDLQTIQTKLNTSENLIHQNLIPEDKTSTQKSINLNELSIKSEYLSNSVYNQEVFQETNVRNNLDDDSTSSLNVNIDTLSNPDRDLEYEQSVQIIDDSQNSTYLSLNKNNDSSVYYSIIELSSEEEEKNSFTTKSNSLKNKENKTHKIEYRPYKTSQIQRKPKTKEINKNVKKSIGKTSKAGRKSKNNKSSKYTEKDYAFVSKFCNKKSIKNLPRISIKTRTKEKNKGIKNKKCTKSIGNTEEFPKPFKIENISQKEQSIATELPKPITFKSESGINFRNIKLHQQPSFQPLVRLKRLKNEELLIPLKTKKVRKSRKQNISCSNKRINNQHKKNDDDDKKDFLIQQAFSLNPRFKPYQIVNRRDNSYDNNEYDHDHHSLFSRITTPISIPYDYSNDQYNESEAKYLSQQELSSHYYTASPEPGSIFSGNIDSGVSTSTPTTVHRIEDNRTLLLEIAAERAFINNHLKIFGYSPIQFQLFNDFNELNVFLKYLIDQTNIN